MAFMDFVVFLVIFKVCCPSPDAMGKALGSSTVTTRFQVTIPGKARRLLKVEEGDILVFFEDGSRVYVSTEA